MTIKEYLKKNKIKQVEIASRIKAPISSINVYCRGWKPLSPKHVASFAKYVGITEDEVRKGKVKNA